MRNASSSAGWTRSSEWQWLSTIGIPDRSSGIDDLRPARGGLVLEEVVRELERVVLLGVGGGPGPTALEVLRRQRRAERLHEHGVPLELVECLGRRLREAPD